MSNTLAADQVGDLPKVDIKHLLERFWPIGQDAVAADQISEAISYLFRNQVSDVQSAALLICLHFTGWDRRSDVLAKTAAAMLKAAAPIDLSELRAVIEARGRKEGDYHGGLCDIVGTGGDAHDTFNISTTASILASSLLLVAKHGNKASTSKSGSADLLTSMGPPAPQLDHIRPDTLARLYGATNYAFLYAPVFHPGMRHVAPVRRQLPWRTLFNLLGPLANPVDAGEDGAARLRSPGPGPPSLLEARVVGVAHRDLGPVFAEALRMAGARKALVVCGDEELDEISCAGPTLCWRLRSAPAKLAPAPEKTDAVDGEQGHDHVVVEHFLLRPDHFGLPTHPLSKVGSGKEPAENAAVLSSILKGHLSEDHPLLHFVLMNTAALLVVSGICEADSSAMGPGDDGVVVRERGPGGGRWKEGMRRARWAIQSGEAARQWACFVDMTNRLGE